MGFDEEDRMETKEINSEGELILQVSGEIDGTAGLRVFLTMQKKLRQRGDDMILKNVSSDVMDIFSVTGFVKLLNIKG